MRYALMLLTLLLAGCFGDGDSDWSVSVNVSPSTNPVYRGQEDYFTGSYTATGTSVSGVSSNWTVQSGPGSYVLNGDGANATGAFYSPGTYVIIYQITYSADDGSFNTSSGSFALSVLGAPPG
jgi:hypothetical protein